MSKEIYLDHHVISKPSPQVIEKLNLYFREKWGKRQELSADSDEALKKLYVNLGVPKDRHFVLTSGGAEAISQLLLEINPEVVATSCLEEAPILLPISRYETQLLRVDENGVIILDDLKADLLSISWANAMTGVIQPIERIAKICHEKGIPLHVNASHVIGKIPLTFEGIDFITFDGDKIHTPQGIGGLIQCTKPRESSSNVAALAALSCAVEESIQRQEQFCLETARLRDTFETELLHALPDIKILFQNSNRLPHISCIVFPGVMSESLLYALHRRKVYASLGGGQFQKLSSQLKNQTALSFAISHETTEDELADALDVIVSSVRKLSAMSQDL